MSKINALLSYHYRIDPDTLSDEQWAKHFSAYAYARAVELKNFQAAFKSSLVEVLNLLFGQQK